MGFFRIICWAIIYITTLRFPPGISIAEILTRQKSMKSNNIKMSYIYKNVVILLVAFLIQKTSAVQLVLHIFRTAELPVNQEGNSPLRDHNHEEITVLPPCNEDNVKQWKLFFDLIYEVQSSTYQTEMRANPIESQ